MTDLERIARAIWADRAARILAEDIAGKTEEGSAGKLTYDELGEKFQAGLMSEARAAVAVLRDNVSADVSAAGDLEMPVHLRFTKTDYNDSSWRIMPIIRGDLDYVPPENVFRAMCDAILNSENAA